MKREHVMHMTYVLAVEKLKHWTDEYMSDYSKTVDIIYDKNEILGKGNTQYDDNGIPTNVIVGIFPLSASFPERYFPIKDSDFVKLGTTMFHEFSHCRRSMSDLTPKEILISDLSKCHNKDYYYAVHHLLPHEIDAEYSGVMSMWSALENEYPDIADQLMFDYLDYRTAGSEKTKKLYMVERPDDGFQSKQQVKDLFNKAYEKSLTGKRNFPDTFLSYDGDTSKLLATNDGNSVRTEYALVYLELLKSKTGIDTDRKMASLVSYVHPELQNKYTALNFEELGPDKIFDMPMPETTEEVRTRLGYTDSFTEGVNYVTKLENGGHEL